MLLHNYDSEVCREVIQRGLPLSGNRVETLGAFPVLDVEKQIMELVEKLWAQREAIRDSYLQLPPYEAHYNPERYKTQVFFLLQNFVMEQCNNFKKKPEGEEEAENEANIDDWDPILNK